MTESGQPKIKDLKEDQVRKPAWLDILPYFLPTLLIIVNMICSYQFNFFSIGIYFSFVVIPLIDSYMMPENHKNLKEKELIGFEKDDRFLLPLYSHLILEYIFLYTNLYYISQGVIGNSFSQFFGILSAQFSAGIVSGVIGHELIHKKPLRDKIFGTLFYSRFFYGHYFIQHVSSHHKMIATVHDASSGRLGEGFWPFFRRALTQGIEVVWDFEKNRLAKEKKSPYTFENRLFSFITGQTIYYLMILIIFGKKAFLFHVALASLSMFALEVVNYVEHYGLERKQDKNGNYESIQNKHSWNTPEYLTGIINFKLQRHSDHHSNVYKPYQILSSFEESPMMPCGNLLATTIAAFHPSDWSKLMDPLAKAYNANEKVSEEQKKIVEGLVLKHNIINAVLMTYLCFF
ncbi:alkane 1-monooxygenase [Stylonychia lemnae]|uniref:Alkane 1-monooxygenase n=1 Tax=Stylonychia lemnae TaxID=5949 RepID=A0A078A4X8_STYLE|nr:alkane 1-monooxygenase [Stylonychia lemnae]|eukprot:CDW76625.1 alkane 1-monooxygenase [Stylonychia lemnae]